MEVEYSQTEAHANTPSAPSLPDQTQVSDGVIASQMKWLGEIASSDLPIKFGVYQLVEKIGSGGAGVVFRALSAKESSPGVISQVAVKLLRPEIVASVSARKRFEKEARLLAEIDSEYVTALIEFGAVSGISFIASEFVEGIGLNQLIKEKGALGVDQSLAIMSDLLSALAVLHDKGVIHRDVKPGNMLLSLPTSATGKTDFSKHGAAKLADFGLARHIEQSDSMAMTRQTATLGTPLYMAPEQQYESRSVDQRADVYSAGVTLYQMIAGILPFDNEDSVVLAEMHRVERPRPLSSICDDVGEALSNVVAKSLEKQPQHRYQHAAEMLADIQCLIDKTPTSLRPYPAIPESNAAEVKQYQFEWELDATPQTLWPLVGDTDRVNRALGLPSPTFSHVGKRESRTTIAEAKFNGMKVRWKEHPFQWIVNRELSVLREFEAGPFEWVTSTVELFPLAGNRTRLVHRFKVKPRGFFGRLLTPFQFAFLTKGTLTKIYQQIEALAHSDAAPWKCGCPFGNPVKLSATSRKNLNQRIEAMKGSIGNSALLSRLSQLVAEVADPVAARLRPHELALQLQCESNELMDVCFQATKEGLFSLGWEIICPACRVASQRVGMVSEIESHANCEACDMRFEVDFANAVELVFKVHPEIRSLDEHIYCIGGPFHAPHVIAQNRLQPRQDVDICTQLLPGGYEIGCSQLDQRTAVEVRESALSQRAEVSFGIQQADATPDMASGFVTIVASNQTDLELNVRLENSRENSTAFTAAMASKHPVFQKLFPNQLLRPEQLVEVGCKYFLGVGLVNADQHFESAGDVKVHQWLTNLRDQIMADVTCDVAADSDSGLVFAFDRLDDLLSSFARLVEGAKQGKFDIEKWGFLIGAGEALSSQQGSSKATFGASVRRYRQRLENAAAGYLILDASVSTEQLGELNDRLAITDSGDTEAVFKIKTANG